MKNTQNISLTSEFSDDPISGVTSGTLAGAMSSLDANPFSPMTLGPLAVGPLPFNHDLTSSCRHFVQPHLSHFSPSPIAF